MDIGYIYRYGYIYIYEILIVLSSCKDVWYVTLSLYSILSNTFCRPRFSLSTLQCQKVLKWKRLVKENGKKKIGDIKKKSETS